MITLEEYQFVILSFVLYGVGLVTGLLIGVTRDEDESR